MNEIISTTSPASRELIVPQPRVGPMAVRVATAGDIPFLDQLQKQYHKQLGFFPRAQLEGYVSNQWILIAENAQTREPLGYCASRDRYLKRDELGVIYQLCVVPGDQRKLVGASLIKAVFERSAYGCRLYCCWCAQDLAANYFWESLGFVPIAFRAGSTGKKRVHIFWQRRIDTELPIADCQASNESNSNRKSQIGNRQSPTPWWFPAKTDQGAMREDRLVLPIPPGLRWSDPMPVMKSDAITQHAQAEEQRAPVRRRVKGPVVGSTGGPQAPTVKPRAGMQFGPPRAQASPMAERSVIEQDKPQAKPASAARAKIVREKHACDPKLIAAARELRDRYLEHVNATPEALPAPGARYDVTRALPAAPAPGGMMAHESHESARMMRDDSCSFVGDSVLLRQLPEAA